MKRTKIIFALLMSAIFALSMVPAGAFAAAVSGRLYEQTGTITVTNAQPGETYNAYRLLELASFTDDSENIGNDQHSKDAYSYVIRTNSPWLDFIENQWVGDSSQKLFNVVKPAIKINGVDYYVVEATQYFANAFSDVPAANKDETTEEEWHSASLVHSFAQNAIGRATGNNPIAADATGMNNGNAPASVVLKNNDSVNLPLGYYVVSSSAGTLCMLDTTNTNIEIADKNILPGITKSVQEDSLLSNSNQAGDGATNYVDVNDASIGDTVYYRTIVTVSKGAQGLSLHDKMDGGLTWTGANALKVYLLKPGATLDTHDENWIELKDGVSVTLESQTASQATTYPANQTPTKEHFYTIEAGQDDYHTSGGASTIGTFHLTLNDGFVTFLSNMIGGSVANYRVVVAYSAILNKWADVGDATKNVNETYLTYGDSSETPREQTSTGTWEFDIRKFTTNNAPANPGFKDIDGAQFKVYLSTDTAKTKPLKFVKNGDGSYRYDSRSSIQDNVVIPAHTDGESIDIIKEVTNVQSPDNDASANTLTVVDTLTTSNGVLRVFGLDGNEFILEESVAPKGYNKLNADIRFRITDVDEAAANDTDSTGGVTYELNNIIKYATVGQVVNKSADSNTLAEQNVNGVNNRLAIENKTGPELPSTGGMGTTIFYVVGGVLVAGAAILLITKRRMGTEA